MTERNKEFINKEIRKFFDWVEDQAYIEGPLYNRSIVSFEYVVRSNKHLPYFDRVQEEMKFQRGEVPGKVKAIITPVKESGYIEITEDLLDKIDTISYEISNKYREEVMPLFKEKRILELQEELKYEQVRYQSSVVAKPINF